MVDYTKGPWLIESSSYGDEYEVYPYNGGPPDMGRWAEVCVVKDYNDDALANANLISASPDMLEALENLIRSNSPEHINAAIDAVAKARGKTNGN